MGPKISAKVEGIVLGLSKANWDQRSIAEHPEVGISQTAVFNIIHSKGKRRQAKAKGLPSPVKYQPPKVVTRDILKRVDLLTSKPNPPGQRRIGQLVNVSQTTVSRLVKKLGKRIARKTRVHKLTPAHMQNRKTRSRRLYEQVLSGSSPNMWSPLTRRCLGSIMSMGSARFVMFGRGKGFLTIGSWTRTTF